MEYLNSVSFWKIRKKQTAKPNGKGKKPGRCFVMWLTRRNVKVIDEKVSLAHSAHVPVTCSWTLEGERDWRMPGPGGQKERSISTPANALAQDTAPRGLQRFGVASMHHDGEAAPSFVPSGQACFFAFLWLQGKWPYIGGLRWMAALLGRAARM